jgi:hypothetical protein
MKMMLKKEERSQSEKWALSKINNFFLIYHWGINTRTSNWVYNSLNKILNSN